MLVRFDRSTDCTEALEELRCRRLRPALYEELLAVAKAYPQIARDSYVFALGSTACVDDVRDAFLSGRNGQRRLVLGFPYHHDASYSRDDRFLAVPLSTEA